MLTTDDWRRTKVDHKNSEWFSISHFQYRYINISYCKWWKLFNILKHKPSIIWLAADTVHFCPLSLLHFCVDEGCSFNLTMWNKILVKLMDASRMSAPLRSSYVIYKLKHGCKSKIILWIDLWLLWPLSIFQVMFNANLMIKDMRQK